MRRHRIDLGQLAILPLIDRFEAARARVTLERRGDWLTAGGAARPLAGFLPEIPPTPATAPCAAARRSRAPSWRVWIWCGPACWPSINASRSGRSCSPPPARSPAQHAAR